MESSRLFNRRMFRQLREVPILKRLQAASFVARLHQLMNTSKSISKLGAGALIMIALVFAVATVVFAKSQPTCWCCVRDFAHKSVVHTSQADCAAQGGKCFKTKQQANKSCGL